MLTLVALVMVMVVVWFWHFESGNCLLTMTFVQSILPSIGNLIIRSCWETSITPCYKHTTYTSESEHRNTQEAYTCIDTYNHTREQQLIDI